MAKNDLKIFAGGSSANVVTQAEYEALASLINGFSTGVAQSKQLNKVWRQSSFVAAMIGLFTAHNSGEDVLDDGDVGGFEQKFSKAMRAFIAAQTGSGSFWQPVVSVTITTPPTSPTLGDAYVIPNAATGAWSGKSQQLAVWFGSSWRIFVPKDGHGVSLPDGRVLERIAGVYVEKPALDVQSGKWLYAEAAGSANVLTATLSPVPASLVAGMAVHIKVSSSNTGAATLNVNGLGAKPIIKSGGGAVTAGDLTASRVAELIYDGTSWQLLSPSLCLIGVQTISAAGTTTYTPTPGTRYVVVEMVGAGGGGGGSDATTSGQVCIGMGGGAGAFARGRFYVDFSGIAVTVGRGGTGGGQAGANGGTTSFGPLMSAPGGIGGKVTAAFTPPGGVGDTSTSPAPSGGNMLQAPGRGAPPVIAVTNTTALPPFGADSIYGPGGGNGGQGIAAGSGGGGAMSGSPQVGDDPQNGGNGADGLILIQEYI